MNRFQSVLWRFGKIELSTIVCVIAPGLRNLRESGSNLDTMYLMLKQEFIPSLLPTVGGVDIDDLCG